MNADQAEVNWVAILIWYGFRQREGVRDAPLIRRALATTPARLHDLDLIDELLA